MYNSQTIDLFGFNNNCQPTTPQTPSITRQITKTSNLSKLGILELDYLCEFCKCGVNKIVYIRASFMTYKAIQILTIRNFGNFTVYSVF